MKLVWTKVQARATPQTPHLLNRQSPLRSVQTREQIPQGTTPHLAAGNTAGNQILAVLPVLRVRASLHLLVPHNREDPPLRTKVQTRATPQLLYLSLST